MPDALHGPRAAVLSSLAVALLVACAPRDDRATVQAAGPPPSVLLVVVDGLRADHLGCHGYPRPTTPTLDALAARGWRFADTMTTAPWSAPALASILGGRYPSTLGWTSLERPVAPDEHTLPRRLARAGWRTAAVVSHEFVAGARGFADGFERFVEVGLAPVDADPAAIAPARRSAEAVSAAALALVDELGTAPFFLLVHYADPLPGWPAVADFDFRAPDYAGELGDASSWREVLRELERYDEADRAQLVALYDGEVAATDRAIGRLFDGLELRGRAQGLFVVVTATSGMELFDHGTLGDQRTLYDELVHVPLIVTGPGVDPRRLDTTASLIDLAPSLCEWLGLEPWDGYEGFVLHPERVWLERVLAAENDRARRLRAVTRGSWKLIADLERGTQELYELARDPRETRDLAAQQGARARELSRVLEATFARAEPSGD